MPHPPPPTHALNDRGACSFAVVADSAGGNMKDPKCKKRAKSCMKLIWVADGVVRDALASLRFELADNLWAKGRFWSLPGT